MSETLNLPTPLTLDQKIANWKKQIANLEIRIYNAENGIVATPKVIELPAVGAEITFRHGRKTATTEPVNRVGTVEAVRPAEINNGKASPALVKVRVGEGFYAELITLFVGQIVSVSGDQASTDNDTVV